MPPPRLIVTPGEPAGIGPEILIGAVMAGARNLVTLDDEKRLAGIAATMGVNIKTKEIAGIDDAANIPPDCLGVIPIAWPSPPVSGKPDPANAGTVIEAIAAAAKLARNGDVAALVTNPVHKATLYEAGFDYPGHTEYLGSLDGSTAGPVMMLCSDVLRIVPLTIHVPLAEVPGLITPERIETVAAITDTALRREFRLEQPRIAVAGLNPHAGEGGAIGSEEGDIIAPTIKKLQAMKINITGPHSADTLFHEDRRAEYDAVIAMYHDQALIPLKTLDFHNGVNTTLGLSFIRTSPDHGTALDVAGKAVANPASLIAAIRLADRMVMNRSQSRD